EDAERVALARVRAEADAEHGTILIVFPRCTRAPIQTVRRCGLDLHRARLAGGVQSKLDFVAGLHLAELAAETPGHDAGHVPVANVRWIELETDAVDGRDPTALL